MILDKLVSAIYNDVVSGLRGYHINSSINKLQLADDIIDTRLLIILELLNLGILHIEDFMISINCIPVDCKDIESCRCTEIPGTPTAHFEIPLLINNERAIAFLGSVDKDIKFSIYKSKEFWDIQKYYKRGKKKPQVYIDTTPNENGMYDCWVYNAPLLRTVSIKAAFKDLRQLENYECCADLEALDDNFNPINMEIKNRLTKIKLQYYRQLAATVTPNTQAYA